MEHTTVSGLIDPLRRQLDDVVEPYTFEDDTLVGYLLDAVKALGSRWYNKYYVTTVSGLTNRVVRNDVDDLFDFSEPPVIQSTDERPIVLQASVIIKGSSKYKQSGSAVSWRDEEIAYSNIESARQRSSTLQDDLDELNRLLPMKLARGKMGHLYGWSREWE